MTGSSSRDASVFDFNESGEWARNVIFDKKSGTNNRTERPSVTKEYFMECFSRKDSVDLVDTSEVNLEYETSNQQGVTTGHNAEEHIDSPVAYNVGHLISGLSVNAALDNDDDKQMTSTSPDPSGEPQLDLISDDEGISERKFSTSNAMSDCSDDEGASEHSDSDISHNSDDYDNMECEDMEVSLNAEFGLFGDVTFLMPRLTFSTEWIKLEIFNQRTSSDEVNDFQWNLCDIECIKSYWLSDVNVAAVILCLKQGYKNKLETFFRMNGASSVMFAFNDLCWVEVLQQITSLNDAYNLIWKSLDRSIFPNEDILSELQPKEVSLAFQDRYFGRFEETFDEFVFPKGDPDAVTISGRDIQLLQPEMFLNDTLIDFYIKYLQTTISDKQREACHFFNSFFFRKLADLDKAPDTEVVDRQAFQRVRKWTRRLNLFEKDYIFIPVNYSLHWSLIVICNPGEVLQDENDSKTPCILHMDSLNGSHENLKKLIQSYLWEEWRERHMEDKAMFDTACERFKNIAFMSLEVPQQDNFSDCGLFLLHYVEMFLREAPAKFSLLESQNKVSGFLTRDWFRPAEASLLKRIHIKKLIHKLYKEFLGTFQAPRYGKSQQSYEAGHIDAGTSQEIEYISENCAPDQACSENPLLLDKVKQISLCHLDDSTQKLSLCQAGKSVSMEGFGKSLRLVCGDYDGIETNNHLCHDEQQFGSFHHNILLEQLKSTLSQTMENDNQSTQDFPSGSCTNQLTSDIFDGFTANDPGKSENETGSYCLGIPLGTLTNQYNPHIDQLLDQQEEHSESSSKRVLCKEGSESPSMSTAFESSYCVGKHEICDRRPRKKHKPLDDKVDEEENKIPIEENEKYLTIGPSEEKSPIVIPSEENEKSATAISLEENENSASVIPSEGNEKYASVMDPNNPDELNISLEQRSDLDILLCDTQASIPGETQVEGRDMVTKVSESKTSPKHVVQSLQHEKVGITKSVSSENDNTVAPWKQKLKSSFAANLNLQDNVSLSNCETVARSHESPEKGRRESFVSCQGEQQSLDCDDDADFALTVKHFSSIEDCARSVGNTPENGVKTADGREDDDSIHKTIENSNKCADSSGNINVDSLVILEGDFNNKAENEDIRVVVVDSKCTNSISNTNEDIDNVGVEGRTESLPGFVDNANMTPESKQKFSLERTADCLSSNDFSSPPHELVTPKTRSRKTPSTVANGGYLKDNKGTPQVLERPRTRSVTKSMDSAKLARENRRKRLSISNK